MIEDRDLSPQLSARAQARRRARARGYSGRLAQARRWAERWVERTPRLAAAAARPGGADEATAPIDVAAEDAARRFGPEWASAGYESVRFRDDAADAGADAGAGAATPPGRRRRAAQAPAAARRARARETRRLRLAALGALTAGLAAALWVVGAPPKADPLPPRAEAAPAAADGPLEQAAAWPPPAVETAPWDAAAPRGAPAAARDWDQAATEQIQTAAIAAPDRERGGPWRAAAIAALPAALTTPRPTPGGVAGLLDISVELDPVGMAPPRGVGRFRTASGGCARREIYFTGRANAPESLRFWAIGRAVPEPCRPASAGASGADGDDWSRNIETASIEGPSAYVSAGELTQLLAARPVKCVPTAAGRTGGCADATVYNAELAQFTRRIQLSPRAELEINAAYDQRGDAICHIGAGLSAIVMGPALSAPQAAELEERARASMASAGDVTCHRLRRLWRADGGEAFVADRFVIGADGRARAAPGRSDPRPFEMRAAL